MIENTLEVNEIIEKIYNGEYNSKDDLRLALKLILNANGTALIDQKNRIREMVEYLSKKEIDGEEYISVKALYNIIDNL